MDENELRDALLRGHESLYATSPIFRANLDYLVALLPLWVQGMATQAESVRGQEYEAYIGLMRSTTPIRSELDESLEGWADPPQTTREQDVALDRLIDEPKRDWRERAKENGVMDRVRERMEELAKEEPPPAEEFEETLRLYREGWDGDPATRKDYERNDNDV